jgi:hypothetical protein
MGNNPAVFPQLNVFDSELDQFFPAQPAADQQRKNGAVALPFQRRLIRN